MIACDIVIVGGGIIGCAIARELSRYSLQTLVIEAANDIACGTTKANGGLIHSGYDPAPGTMKSKVNARGNKLYSTWSKELGFEFKRTGSIVLAFTQSDCEHLQTLLENGHANGVEGLEIVGPERIHELEPQASPDAIQALYCPHTGIVDPFDVAIAAAENATANGVEFLFNAPVQEISQTDDGFVLHTPKGDVSSSWVVNAAGCYADAISDMAGGEHFEIGWRQGNLLVLDKNATAESIMPIYPVPTPTTKGVVVMGTVHGNVLIGSTAVMREKGDLSCYADDIDELMTGAIKLVPSLNVRSSIRQFAGGRAVITDTNDFFIGQSKNQPRLFQAAGIQSPGVASAPAIAEYMVECLRDGGVPLVENPNFDPVRHAPEDFDIATTEHQNELIQSDPAWGRIVCRCETVPEAEIVAAIHRTPGATSVEGVKRRCRAGMGRCQSGFCQSRVVDILSRELGIAPAKVLLENPGSEIVLGPVKGDD